jgi:SulP family sulfate permease
MIAIVEAYKAGLLSFRNFKSNIMAGFIVGIISLPLSMAFAIASGVKPEDGIYTAIISGLVVGIFGGTRVQISGPTGAFVVILAAITAKFGVDGLHVATLMAGIILVLMGLFKIGNAIRFIPYPVIVGFTSGIGVIIFVGQLKYFFGLPVSIPIDAPFYQKILLILRFFTSLDFKTTALSFLSLFIVVTSPRYVKSVPSPLLAMIIATVIQFIGNFQSVATIGSVFGHLPQMLPGFDLPNFDKISLTNLIGPAFTIALLGAIESLLSAAAADSITGTKHNSNQELIGQGLANFLAPLWGGFASTGALARTVTNIRHGGNSPIAAIFNSITLLLIILIFAHYAVYIPFSALAAILFVVAFNMGDIPEFIHVVKKAPWYDVITLMVTFLLTIFTDLIIAVFIGVIISMLFFVLRLVQTSELGGTSVKNIGKVFKSKVTTTLPNEGIIYNIEGPFFFGVAEKFEHALSVTHTDPKFIIFSFKRVPFIDMTGLETFSKILEQYYKRGVRIYLCEANKKVSQKLLKVGILSIVCSNQIFHSLEDVIGFKVDKESR